MESTCRLEALVDGQQDETARTTRAQLHTAG